MNEEKQVKNQLIKNMVLNLIAFSIIFYLFGTFVYGKFYKSLYLSADSELQTVMHQFSNDKKGKNDIPKRQDVGRADENKLDIPGNSQNDDIKLKREEHNPRLIFIYRDEKRKHY